ncbi:putative 1,4-dihydroxy-2-naphthoate octaprenyltransferase [Chlamydiales bacterium STE3]|nr:putative 1,4-dihydroxy-2-naphthoate octaprenyltransferase [Chlamydiales bacterium STE3]
MERTLKKLSWKSWILAARPKTLSAGIVPIAVGTFLANKPLVSIDWFIALCTLLFSFMIQIATNLINDALDFKKGADTNERLGPLRVTQAGLLSSEQVMRGAFVCFAFAFLFSIPLILKGGVPLLVLVLSSICCSYLYTGGPFPLAYIGLGEIFVILFYGFFATLTSYFLQTGEWGGVQMLVISFELGCLITVLLAINNLRDVQEDQKSNKKTLAARFGASFARKEIAILVGLPFLLNFFWIYAEQPLLFFLPMTVLPMGLNIVKRMFQYTPGKIYNSFLGEASLLTLIYGFLLILGFRFTH